MCELFKQFMRQGGGYNVWMRDAILPAMVIIPRVREDDIIEVANLDPQTRQYSQQRYGLIRDPAPLSPLSRPS